MELLKVMDPAKAVTDPVLSAALERQRINVEGVEFARDYGSPSQGGSPYGKFYRDLNSEKKFAVISGLPMVDVYGQAHELIWKVKNGSIESGNNLFHASIEGLDTRLTALSDQPGGVKRDEMTFYHPQLFIGGSEIKPLSLIPGLLETDPVNLSYHYNVLEWDYGFCRRRVRLVEGRFSGCWVFTDKPRREVRIKYNRKGNIKLSLGRYRLGADEERIPVEAFIDTETGINLIISDTAAFYPDADPESTTVDGDVFRYNPAYESWAAIHNSTGTGIQATGTPNSCMAFYVDGGANSSTWEVLARSIFLFNLESLAGNTISEATLSAYGVAKYDTPSWNPAINAYASSPASNTDLAAGDYLYSLFGTTPWAEGLSYGSMNASGWNDLVFNAAGITAAQAAAGSIFKTSIRESNYDAADIAPSWNSGMARLQVYCAEQGAGYKPKLVVTYTSGQSKASGDSGSGMESIVLRSLEIPEQGAAAENSVMNACVIVQDTGAAGENGGAETGSPPETVSGTDAGFGTELLKMLRQQGGTDMKLKGNRGQLGLPGKEIHL